MYNLPTCNINNKYQYIYIYISDYILKVCEYLGNKLYILERKENRIITYTAYNFYLPRW